MRCGERSEEAIGLLAVGDIEIVLLGDRGAPYSSRMDRSSAGYGRWLPYLRRHPWTLSGVRVGPARFCSYLVRSLGLTVLVDAGMGPVGLGGHSLDGTEESTRLEEEVDVVFVTHSHPLEAGWAFTADGKPAFPGVRYVAQWAEWEAASPEPSSFLRRLDEMGMLDLLDDEEELAEDVTAVPTPGHQSMLVSSGGEEALVVGDAFAHPTQIMDPLWSSAQDGDGARATWTRMGLLDWLRPIV